jgi:hypothetical protein
VKDTWLSKGKSLFKHNIIAIIVLGSLLTPSSRIIKTLCFFKKRMNGEGAPPMLNSAQICWVGGIWHC